MVATECAVVLSALSLSRKASMFTVKMAHGTL